MNYALKKVRSNLTNIFLKNHCAQQTTPSSKERKQMILKLAD